ncbi:hypothetical protein BX666DRAFT_1537997 [Dichotomocladium elegans]|nr:hypothetical protein BX666DRAFT_1537997 [Dichotomocladium elegans]
MKSSPQPTPSSSLSFLFLKQCFFSIPYPPYRYISKSSFALQPHMAEGMSDEPSSVASSSHHHCVNNDDDDDDNNHPLRERDSSSIHDDGDDELKIPPDIVRLTLLMVSGNRHTMDFAPSTTVFEVKTHILNHWPQEFARGGGGNSAVDQPKSLDRIEILYLGKFLANETTLEVNRLQGGDSFTVHLLIRDQPSKSLEDAKDTEPIPRCKCCIIL